MGNAKILSRHAGKKIHFPNFFGQKCAKGVEFFAIRGPIPPTFPPSFSPLAQSWLWLPPLVTPPKKFSCEWEWFQNKEITPGAIYRQPTQVWSPSPPIPSPPGCNDVSRVRPPKNKNRLCSKGLRRDLTGFWSFDKVRKFESWSSFAISFKKCFNFLCKNEEKMEKVDLMWLSTHFQVIWNVF